MKMDSHKNKQAASNLRRHARGLPFSSEDRKLFLRAANAIEQLEQRIEQLEQSLEQMEATKFEQEREAILAFLEEKGVPLTPEQKADLGIDE